MKYILISFAFLVTLTPIVTSAEESMSPAESLLHQMEEASASLNYELSYVLIRKNKIDSFTYRHAQREGVNLSHLMYLNGIAREVIKRNDEVSYLEQGNTSFSIKTNNMVAPIIPLLNKNFNQLSQYYDFISMGRAREAGTISQVVRITSKDGKRYSYVVWIDERSKLPMRTDLTNNNGDIVEQYKVVSHTVNEKIFDYMMEALSDVELPKILNLPPIATSDKATWTAEFIPDGFKKMSFNRYQLPLNQRKVETKIFSDGLFHFSIYVSKADKLSLRNQVVYQGQRSLHNSVKGEYEISVVGDIPATTARQIAESVVFTFGKNKEW